MWDYRPKQSRECQDLRTHLTHILTPTCLVALPTIIGLLRALTSKMKSLCTSWKMMMLNSVVLLSKGENACSCWLDSIRLRNRPSRVLIKASHLLEERK